MSLDGPDRASSGAAVDIDPWPDDRASWRRRGRLLLSGLAVVFSLTVLTKAFAGVREIVVARTFGVGPDMDAFVVAFGITSLGIGVTVSSVSASLVPAFVSARDQRGAASAARVLGNALALVIAGVSGLALVLALASPLLVRLIGSGFDEAQQSQTEQLLVVLLPMMVIGSIGAVASAVLLAEKRFARAHVGQMMNPVLVLLVMLVIGSHFGIGGLAVATLAGFALEAGLLLAMLRISGFSPMPRWHGADEPTRRLVRQFLPMFGAMLLASLNLVVDQAMASPLGPGNLSAMTYGSRLVALALTISATALGTVALPHYSELVSRRSWAELRHGLVHQSLVVSAVTVPVAVAMVLLARPLVQLVFVGGAFSSSDVDQVADVQAMFALQIPFYVLVILYGRVLNALQINRLFLVVTGIALVVNGVGDVILRGPLGVAGIALSTSLVLVGEWVTLVLILFRLLHPRNAHRLDVLEVARDPVAETSESG